MHLHSSGNCIVLERQIPTIILEWELRYTLHGICPATASAIGVQIDNLEMNRNEIFVSEHYQHGKLAYSRTSLMLQPHKVTCLSQIANTWHAVYHSAYDHSNGNPRSCIWAQPKALDNHASGCNRNTLVNESIRYRFLSGKPTWASQKHTPKS